MPQNIFYPLFASLIISSLSFSGALFFIQKRVFKGNLQHYLVSFAAGVMLSTALLDVLPEALESHEHIKTMWAVLIGIIIAFMMERFVLWYHHHHDDSHFIKPSAYLVIIGDSFHNFIDGLAIAATFIVNPGVGIATTIAIAAHEIPQEMADLSILISSGLNKKRALILNFISGLTAILGVVIGLYFINNYSGVTDILLGFTAGIFLYIPLADLIPELHSDHRTQNNWRFALTFLLGIATLAILSFFLHESIPNTH